MWGRREGRKIGRKGIHYHPAFLRTHCWSSENMSIMLRKEERKEGQIKLYNTFLNTIYSIYSYTKAKHWLNDNLLLLPSSLYNYSKVHREGLRAMHWTLPQLMKSHQWGTYTVTFLSDNLHSIWLLITLNDILWNKTFKKVNEMQSSCHDEDIEIDFDID